MANTRATTAATRPVTRSQTKKATTKTNITNKAGVPAAGRKRPAPRQPRRRPQHHPAPPPQHQPVPPPEGRNIVTTIIKYDPGDEIDTDSLLEPPWPIPPYFFENRHQQAALLPAIRDQRDRVIETLNGQVQDLREEVDALRGDWMDTMAEFFESTEAIQLNTEVVQLKARAVQLKDSRRVWKRFAKDFHLELELRKNMKYE